MDSRVRQILLPRAEKFFNYVPTPQQRAFHIARFFKTFRGVFCGKGAGKTIANLAEALMYGYHYPGSVVYLFEPNYPMIRRNIIPLLNTKWLLGEPFEKNPHIKEFRKSDNCLIWKNSSETWFVSLDAPERAEGSNIDAAGIDEPRLIRDFDLAWKSVTSRIRGSGRCAAESRCPNGVWATSTPDRPKSPMWNIFENPMTKADSCAVFRWSTLENPKLSEAYKKEMLRLNTGGYARRFIYGEFADVAEGTFPFDTTKHVFITAPSQLKCMKYGVDFGWANPSAIVAVGFDYDGRAFVLDEFYQSQVTTEDLIGAMLEMQRTYGAGKWICDRASPEAIMKMRRSGLSAVGYETNREDSVRELGSRFAVQKDGKPRIMVSSQCSNLISELLTYNILAKENDHAVDALRYAVAGDMANLPEPAYF